MKSSSGIDLLFAASEPKTPATRLREVEPRIRLRWRRRDWRRWDTTGEHNSEASTAWVLLVAEEHPLNATVMDGSAVARKILSDTAVRATRFVQATGRQPCLATVLVGDDPASHTYVRMKTNRCRATGLDSRRHHLSDTATTADAVALVEDLADDSTVDGILVQHPMPPQIDERRVFEAIPPGKDVDGVTGASFAGMALGGSGFASCTPGGIMRLLDAYDVDLVGARAVVIGRSPILGKPVGMLLLARDATVTYCHSKTTDLAGVVAGADVVVAAVGRAELVKGAWIKLGAIVIDAGYNPGNVGDVEYTAAARRARLITPVPGGVGPTTIAVLLAQTVDAAEAASYHG
jgi:methylenetetrahydrofolate dehydrogenase (NADP+)/methenyltetrahydrofolate cyclohydrolase